MDGPAMAEGSRAIVLLSGGLDSVVTAALVARTAEVLALTFDYGQRAAVRELRAAREVARRIGAEWEAVELAWLGRLGASALTESGAEMPVPGSGEELDEMGAARARAEAVWVPNRNGVFVAVGGAYADARGYDYIALGLNREEGATFPDNTLEFAEAATGMLMWSTMRHPRVIGPTAGLRKDEIVRLGREIGAPLDAVWSCYEGGEEMCGRCESCMRLRRAMEEAGA
jgi:7-cyano-7-deazaguanine synthase